MHPRQGFTLFELLIALLLISVGISAGLQVAFSSIRLGSQAQLQLLAGKGVAEYQLELLRSKSFTDLVVGATPFSTPTSLLPLPGSLPNCPAGNCYWVESVGTDLKKVTIRVVWTDSDNRARSSVISTLISKNGLSNPG